MPAPTIRSGLNYQKEFWNVNLSNTTTFEQSRFPDNNFDIDVIENGEIVSKPVDISTPPKGYSILNLSGSHIFS